MSKPLLLVVAAVMIDPDDRILISKRPEGKHMGGLWEFPGGKIEEGETPEQALVRELDEELNLKVKEACLAPLTFASHSYEKFHLLMPIFACRRWEGDLVAKDGQDLAWVRANRLKDYDMPPADAPLKATLRDLI